MRIEGITILVFCMLSLSACSMQKQESEPSSETSHSDTGNGHILGLNFSDVTEVAGLGGFSYENGQTPRKLFPESMGSGGGFIDYNNDNWEDILLVGGGPLESGSERIVPAVSLYHNNRDGSFTLVNKETGLDEIVNTYSHGIAVADYDNDGDQDFYLTTLYENMLFNNDNGTFREIGQEAGVTGPPEWSSSAVFFDADNDGWPDIYHGNFIAWSTETELFCSLDGVTKTYCTPELYKGIPGRYYHNNGNGTFTEQTKEAGFITSPGKTLGVAVFDYNRDGWQDIFVSNDTQPDLLYENNGDGTFSEKGALSGIAYDENGRARAGMGIDIGIVDKTCEPTLFVGNFSKEMIGVFQYIGNSIFIDRAALSRIGKSTLRTLTFGLFLFDVDLDGDLDLFAANGHVHTDVAVTQEGITYREPPHLFINDGAGNFQDIGEAVGGPMQKLIVGRGTAYADYDHDGDLDILVTDNSGPAHLWRNDLSNGAHYLRVKLSGHEHNRDAFGTEVTAVNAGQHMHRMIRTGSSFLSSFEKTLTFGLGEAITLDSLIIHWNDGHKQIFTNVPADQQITVHYDQTTIAFNDRQSNEVTISNEY